MSFVTFACRPATVRRHLLAFAATLASAAILPAPAPAETPIPELIGDFSPGRQAANFVPREITEIGGRLYFTGSDPQHGAEPWVSDGTPAGTRRLADLCAGPCPSYARAFTAVGGRIVFSTYIDQAIYSIEQDQVEGLAVGIGDVQRFHVLGPIAYFNAGPDFRVMMRTDGTAAGTRPTADFCPETSSEPCYGAVPQPANGRVYFTQGHFLHVLVAEGDRRQLIELDLAQEFTELDAGRAIFRGCLAGVCRAYVTDGTPGGTRVLEPIAGGSITAGARDFVRFQGRVHFATGADRLASTDGTPAGTQLYSGTLVQPPLPLAANSSVLLYAVEVPNGELTGVSIIARQAGGAELVLVPAAPNFRLHGQLGEKIFFMVSSTLMVTDGTAAGTVALAESGGESPGVPFAGAYHFGLDPNGEQPGGLFRSDGTPAGTAPVDLGLSHPNGTLVQFWDLAGFLVARLAPASGGGIADDLYRIGPLSLEMGPVIPGRPLFQMATGRRVLYAGDRETGQVIAVKESGALELPTGGGVPHEWAISEDDRLYYTKSATGQKLFETDGTVAGTREVFDLRPEYSAGCSGHLCLPHFPQAITPSGDRVFFVATASGSTSAHITSLWSWRRGQAPIELLRLDDSYSPFIPAPGGRVIFASRIGLAPTQPLRLWQSDGTVAGTRPYFELPGFAGPELHVQAGNRIFFTLASGGGVLLVSDLTTAGTYPLAGGEGFAITELVASGPQVLFSGKSSLGQQAELGYSDGTPAGTGWLDIVPGPFGAQPRHLRVIGDGRVVFAAAGDGAGQEVWITDGDLAGTRRLTDLAPGAPASAPSGFAAFGNHLFFGASDGATGFEPWRLFLDSSSLPTCPPSVLCLHRGRFEVTAEMLVGDRRFPSRSQLSTAESGVFGFFSENNWEMLVKVLDGCAINDAFWVYAAAATDQPYVLRVLDRDSGQTRTYEVPAFSSGPILDGAAFASCGAAPTPRPYAPGSLPAAPASRCADDPDALCLGPGGRYRVELDWRTADLQGAAHPVANGTADSGLFTFFSPSNWESMVKVLDGCAINGKIWVFAAATTDVGWELTVTDTESGARKLYSSPLGTPAKTVQDTAAFDCP